MISLILTGFVGAQDLPDEISQVEKMLAGLDTRVAVDKDEYDDAWKEMVIWIQSTLASSPPAEHVSAAESSLPKNKRYAKEFPHHFAGKVIVMELAIQREQPTVAWRLINEISRQFKYEDEIKKRVEILALIIEKNQSRETFAFAFDLIRPFLHNAIRRDDLESVATAIKDLEKASGKKIDRDLKDELKKLESKVRVLIGKYRKIQEPLEILKQDPNNAEANRMVGEYYFIGKKEFYLGARFLSLGPETKYTQFFDEIVQTNMLPDKARDFADKWWPVLKNTKKVSKDFVETIARMYHISLRSKPSVKDESAIRFMDEVYGKNGEDRFRKLFDKKLTLLWDNKKSQAEEFLMIKKDGTAVYQRLNKQAETLQWYYFHSGIRVRVDEGYYMQVDITSSGGMLVAYRYFWTDLPLRSAYVE